MFPYTKSSVVNKTMDVKLCNKKKSSSFTWSLINGLVFVILSYDLSYKCPHYTSYFHYVEYTLALLFGLNTLYHTVHYLNLRLATTPITATAKQRKLLGFSLLDSSCRSVENDGGRGSKASESDVILSDDDWCCKVRVRNWTSRSASLSSSATASGDSCPSPSSPVYYHNDMYDSISDEDSFICDHRSLADYIKRQEEREAASVVGALPVPIPGGHSSGERVRARHRYQIAPLDKDCRVAEENAVVGGVVVGGGGGCAGGELAWWSLRLDVDPQQLTQWNLHLRLWLHATVLERVVREVRSVDDALARQGLSDVRVGCVGLERLMRAAKHMPSLSALIPFIDLTDNQEYLLQRIRELESGGCLSAFKWNGGGNYHERSWEECPSLPTDAEILMHLFASYMDSQLMPGTQQPDGRPFTSKHLCKSPEKPSHGPDTLVIYRASARPPHYLIVRGDKTLDVGKGRNNLLHTILLFTEIVYSERSGILDRVHLGPAGVNLLWVIGR